MFAREKEEYFDFKKSKSSGKKTKWQKIQEFLYYPKRMISDFSNIGASLLLLSIVFGVSNIIPFENQADIVKKPELTHAVYILFYFSLMIKSISWIYNFGLKSNTSNVIFSMIKYCTIMYLLIPQTNEVSLLFSSMSEAMNYLYSTNLVNPIPPIDVLPPVIK